MTFEIVNESIPFGYNRQKSRRLRGEAGLHWYESLLRIS
jgi:hypothetical protein